MAGTADVVAREGVDAMLRGQSLVVPGVINKIYLNAVHWLPPKLLRFVTHFAWS